MPHIVTQACCGDASCVFACPVNCIHPTPDEPDFATSEMVYIDPDSCVDCGACVNACPVGAITPDTKLSPEQQPFVDINAMFYREPRSYPSQAQVPTTVELDEEHGRLRVAIVGSGPAALYAADELLKQPGVEVNVFEKLPTPHGLVRAGVAPDHQNTKTILGLFEQIEDQAGFAYFLNVDVGTDISHDELLAHHHAVLYASGASTDRALDIAGADLTGSITATEFVAWYNGHPDFADRMYDFSGRRAVIVGNGNVALDVARVLTSDPERLATTDIADYALEALRHSNIEEVVLLGRRGPAQAAFTLPELTGLQAHTGANLVVDGGQLELDAVTAAMLAEGKLDAELTLKLDVLERIAASAASGASGESAPGRKRIVFRFWSSPIEFVGPETVTAVRVVRNEPQIDENGVVRAVRTGAADVIETDLVLRSIGYRGAALDGLPFDPDRGVVPNIGGRVLKGVKTAPGVYVAGWIKRGPSGFIGTNKTCSAETVSNLLTDSNRGILVKPTGSRAEFKALIDRLAPDSIGLDGWRILDRAERSNGVAAGRPRVKFTDIAVMQEVVAGSDERPAYWRRWLCFWLR